MEWVYHSSFGKIPFDFKDIFLAARVWIDTNFQPVKLIAQT